ncbi:hypothetical protein JTB14_017160 [Gonioctena quinquepunctata]|nr:hypothetical protein JTB14_017160 [Gonioctena quinquepunctata]
MSATAGGKLSSSPASGNAVSLKPIEVPQALQNGEKFIKWDEDSGVGTPVTLRVDPQGFYLYWVDQNHEMDLLDIAIIRDTRTGRYAKIPKEYKCCEVIDLALSDHYGQFLELEIHQSEKENKFRMRRVFSEARLRYFSEELERENWDEIMNCTEVNRAYNNFIYTFRTLMNRVFPLKKCKNVNISKSWVTNGIRISCAKKHYLHKEMLLGHVTKDYYKKYSSILRQVTRKAKRKDSKDFIVKAENKTKATWSLVKRITNNTSNNEKKNILQNLSKSDPQSSSHDILNRINDFYINSAPDIKSGEEGYDIQYSEP